MPSNSGKSQNGNRNGDNNNNKENAGSHQKKGKHASAKRFQGAAPSSSILYQKVITATGNQNTQFVALKHALIIYAGTTAKVPLWSDSINKMEREPETEFHLTPPDRNEYGTYTNNVFEFNNVGDEDKFTWKKMHYQERIKEGYKKLNEYERAGKELYVAIQGQVELVVWDALAIDLNFEDAVKLQCPIAILTILADRCARTDHTSYQPLVMIEHLQATRFWQKPRGNGPSMPTGEYKRYIEIHVQTAYKSCGALTFGAKHWRDAMAKDGRVPEDYFNCSKSDRKKYDKQALDRIIATLMIQGCKYPALRQYLVNQQLATGNDSAYPKTANDAARLIDDGTWGKEHGAPSGNGNHGNSNGGNHGSGKRQVQRSSTEEVVGSHVRYEDSDAEDEDGVNDDKNFDDDANFNHIMATIGSTGAEHRNAFEPIETEEDFDEESIGEIVGAITTVPNRLVNAPEEDHYELVDHESKTYDDIRNLADRQPGMSISERHEMECEYLTGGGMTHGFGCDFHPQLYPKEEREHARRIAFPPSPNNESVVSLQVLLHRLNMLINDGYGADAMQDDLKAIGVENVSGLFNIMTKDGNVDYETMTKKFEQHGLPRLKDKTIIYMRGMAMWMQRRYDCDHEYYLQMAAIMDEENQHAVGGIVAQQNPSVYESTKCDETNRVIQGMRAYNSKKNGSRDEYLDHHTTMAGMMRTTIKLREPFLLPMNMFNMNAHLKRMLETTEEERAEADDVFKCAFPDSYPYVDPTDEASQQLFQDFH